MKVARSNGKFNPTLILVGTRLGLDKITPVYWEPLKSTLQMQQSIGIAGWVAFVFALWTLYLTLAVAGHLRHITLSVFRDSTSSTLILTKPERHCLFQIMWKIIHLKRSTPVTPDVFEEFISRKWTLVC